MRIVKLKGGLGNQMFQYVFAKLIEEKTGDVVKLDLSAYEGLKNDSVRMPRIMRFNISLPVAERADLEQVFKLSHRGNSLSLGYKIGSGLEFILNRRYYFEKDRAYRNPTPFLDKVYFDGYWQSWRFVDVMEAVWKKDFVPNYKLHHSTIALKQKIENENSVFLGVRKGDYTAEASHYGTFSQVYFDEAIKYVCERIANPVFYIFSNDIAWVKANMKFDGLNVVYREPEDVVNDFEDLLLMSSCHHSIMLNSTYHWWGSRLNEHPDKIIIAPKKWFADDKPIDIVPERWIRL